MSPSSQADAQDGQEESDRLRGLFIRLLNEQESYLDGVLTAYFGAHHHKRADHFRSWILAKLGMAAKVDIMADIFKTLGVEPEFRDSLATLRGAVQHRNALAHSYESIDASWMRPDMTAVEVTELALASEPVTMSLQKRGGPKPLHDEETRRWTALVEDLWPTAIEMQYAVFNASSSSMPTMLRAFQEAVREGMRRRLHNS